MLDVAIVGGGLSGLALGVTLQEKGVDYTVFEARDRLGGRILTRQCPVSSIDFDLGPTWYWPETQPLIRQWVQRFGLSHFDQPDDGSVLVLTETDKKPGRLENENIHAGAQRLAGGMDALSGALIELVPDERRLLSHRLTSVIKKEDHVELEFSTSTGDVTIKAKRVVLAMPPRLIEEHIYFSPKLSRPFADLLLDTPTWMATQAKAVSCYANLPDYRDRAGSGNAFVQHEQAVLGEIFDLSPPEGDATAMGGFVALSPALRKSFRTGLNMLVSSQFAQVFGAGFETGEIAVCDWAEEPLTCSSQDLRAPASMEFDHFGPAGLRQPQWDGTLFFAGTETAEVAAGYLEGAISSALRVVSEL